MRINELELLNREVSLVRLLERADIMLARRGGDTVARCPFHDDASLSLKVSEEANHFHCGVCGVAGGPIEWVMKKNGVSLRHAAELLREGLPGVTDETVKHSTVRALPPPVASDADGQALL